MSHFLRSGRYEMDISRLGFLMIGVITDNLRWGEMIRLRMYNRYKRLLGDINLGRYGIKRRMRVSYNRNI